MSVSEQDAAPGYLSALFYPILKTILAELAVDAVCLYASDEMDAVQVIACCPDSADSFPAVSARLWAGIGLKPLVLDTPHLTGTPFAAALLLPLSSDMIFLDALALFSRTDMAFTSGHLERLSHWIAPLNALLEHHRRNRQRDMINQMRGILRTMDSSNFPGEIAKVLHEISPRTTTCAMLAYGPLREDMPVGPFEYLEVQGTWSKRHGGGIGIGVRLYLEVYTDLLAELNEKKMLVLETMEAIKHRVDPLVSGFLRAERVRSAVIFLLGSPQSPIGAIMIATDDRIPFTTREIISCRLISELLGANALTRLLHQQRVLAQQGRAALLDAVTDGVVTVVPDAGHANAEGYVYSVNQAFSHLFGIDQSKTEGISLFQLLEMMRLPEDITTILLQEWSKIMVRNPSTQRGEFEFTHVEGYSLNIEWYSAPVYQDRRVQGRIYIFHDASAKRAAERLRYNFISRLSHELRTPLSSIQGYAQLLLDGSSLPERPRGHIQTIFDNALRLNDMFSDVILIARADTGELRLQMEFTLLPELIQNTARMVEARASARGQRIILELEDPLPYVYIDPHYIARVVTEVLRNATLYAPPDSDIHIKAAPITRQRQLPNGAPTDPQLLPGILVTVADEGPGFQPEDAEAIFLPFHRGKNASSAQIPGVGLGLTIARSLVELHRGKIWAGAHRRGRHHTRFYFILPAVPA